MTEGFNKVSSLLDRLPGMERNEDFQTMEIKPGWRPSEPQTMEIGPDWRPGGVQTLPYRPDGGLGMTQAEPKYPIWDRGPGRGFPPIGMPTPGESGGGWKMECTPVPSTPQRPTWPGLGVPGNI